MQADLQFVYERPSKEATFVLLNPLAGIKDGFEDGILLRI